MARTVATSAPSRIAAEEAPPGAGEGRRPGSECTSRARGWLEAHWLARGAMESTGAYWRLVFHILEEACTCLLVNAAHVQQVPGRRTDVQDCAWIAPLREHGLLRRSFVPPGPIRELARYRQRVIQDRAREANRLPEVLRDAGIQLSSASPAGPCGPPWGRG